MLAVALLCAAGAGATSVLQMNLETMCAGAHQIFRGTIVDMYETTIEVGGGTLPAVTYVAEVKEAFAGDFETVKGVTVARFTVVGTLKQHQSGQHPIPGLPTLEIGGDYLLLVAPAGPVGLTATMGLGQGCFTISGKPGEETAVNAIGNAGLFDGMSAAGMPSSGPVSYSTLADLIHSLIGGGA
ncbi:MAG: hypothetical protein D6696_02970 [Acidobacteria bacterium]|nr:MAG: hypothetical protein D6696_02970 [Acidobacteriota bacterium]